MRTADALLAAFALLALAGVADLAAAQRSSLGNKFSITPCKLRGTWFPSGYEDSASPAPLRLSSQESAGWNGTGRPILVGLSDAAIPRFFVGPRWFGHKKGPVLQKCRGSVLPLLCPKARRAASSGKLGQSADVKTPVSYDITWQLNNGPHRVIPELEGGLVGSIDLADIWFLDQTPDGYHCLKAAVTAIQRSGTVEVGGKSYHFPCKAHTSRIEYCFVKLSQEPTAKVKWSSCSSNFTVSITHIKPRPVYDPVHKVQLFSTVIQVRGNATRADIDDTRQGNDHPRSYSFSDEDIQITSPRKGHAKFTTDKLLDGNYTLHVNLHVKSSFPQLMNISGPTPAVNGAASTYLSAPALDSELGAKVVVFHEKSSVYGLTCPKDPVMKLPQQRTFQWLHTGVGMFNCFVDGKLVGMRNGCRAPLVYVLADHENHTLAVQFTDKCNQHITRKFLFGAWGCTLAQHDEPHASVGSQKTS